MPVATLHAVNGHSMTNVPDEWRLPFLRWVVSGVWSVCSGVTRRLQHRRRLYRRLYAKSAYREVCSGDTGHAEAVRIVYILPSSAMSSCYRYFGRITIPPGNASGQ